VPTPSTSTLPTRRTEGIHPTDPGRVGDPTKGTGASAVAPTHRGPGPTIASVKVSTRGDYASRALLSLSLHEGEGPTSVRDIAERTGLPQPYLEQILLALKGAGLVRSKRGVGGGYVLARSPEEINLAQIISAVDGPIRAGDFGEPHTDGACDHEGQCVLLAIWGDVGATMARILSEYTLADLRAMTQGVAPWPEDPKLGVD
jgi:Rrf2 family protein